MSDSKNENRVLGRMGARKLTDNEAEQIVGGFIPTLLSVIRTNNGSDFSLDS